MHTLKKYELEMGEKKITMPDLAEIAFTTDCDGKVWVWMEVDTDTKEFVDRPFFVMREGEEMKDRMMMEYIGYAHLPSGEVVVVFEIL
jgi:hypothetical protein